MCNCNNYYNSCYECQGLPNPPAGRYAIPCFPYFNPALVPAGKTWLPNGTIVPAPVTPSYNPGCSCAYACTCSY